MSKVYYSDEEYAKLLRTLGDLTGQIDKIDDPLAKEMILHILQHFDAVHREPLHRLWQFIRKNHPQIREKVLTDYSLRHILALYDLEDYNGVETPNKNTIFVSEDQVTKL